MGPVFDIMKSISQNDAQWIMTARLFSYGAFKVIRDK